MRKSTTSTIRTALSVAGTVLFFLASPDISSADIYRWVDDAGVVHFTDDPANIPAKFRNRKEHVLKGPPASGQPSLSTMPPPSPSKETVALPPGTGPRLAVPPEEDPAGQAEQLRAKIGAKERFIEGIDRKRSHALNPLGNRFVSPGDLELYKKYQDELPNDKTRLREIDPASP